MAMYRIMCPECGWGTNPHYYITDCIKEKEAAHISGLKEGRFDAHDSAFGDMCPACGKKTKEIFRYFSNVEIEGIKEERKRNTLWLNTKSKPSTWC